MEITSIKNDKVKRWLKYTKKKYRDEDKCFLVEGEHLIQEALKAKRLVTLLMREGNTSIFSFTQDVYTLSSDIMDALSMTVSKADYIGVVSQESTANTNTSRVLLLDDIQDPGNLGTLIRSAHSFGFDTIYLSNHCVDAYNDKVVRSTQGSLFHVAIERVYLDVVVKQLKRDGFHVYATSLTKAEALSDIKVEENIAIILGNEGSGVSEELCQLSDKCIKIEALQFESLNVGVAGSICMYHFRREK